MNRGRHKKSKEKEFNTRAEILDFIQNSFINYQQYVKIDQHIVYMIIMQKRVLVVTMEETIVRQLRGILILDIILMIL